MSPLQKRALLFLLGCVPARLALVLAALRLPTGLVAAGLAIPAAGMALIYATGARKTGAETLGAPIWWNQLRPVHAGAYALAAGLLLRRRRAAAAWVLGADVAFGLVAFVVHHCDCI
jgi:hypothetical protein